jgi:hypothetical protein
MKYKQTLVGNLAAGLAEKTAGRSNVSPCGAMLARIPGTSMPYDRGLSERLEAICGQRPGMAEKKMFGGIGWMLDGNMVAGVYQDFLIVRVGEEGAKSLLREKFVKPMDITGKPMKGWLMVSPRGYDSDADLRRYTEAAVAFVKTLPPKSYQ